MASSGHIKATLNWCVSKTFKKPSGHVNNPEANRMWYIYIYAIQFWWVAFLYVMQFPKAALNHLTVSIRKQVVGPSFKSTITISDYVIEAAAHTKFQISDCILSQCFFFDGCPRYCWLIYEPTRLLPNKKTGFDHSCWQAKHVPSSLWFWNNSNRISAV